MADVFCLCQARERDQRMQLAALTPSEQRDRLRKAESAQASQARKSADRLWHAEERAAWPEAAAALVRAADRQQHAVQRAQMPEAATVAIREADRQQHAITYQKRQKAAATSMPFRSLPGETLHIKPHDCGHICDAQCQFCSAWLWKAENVGTRAKQEGSICCCRGQVQLAPLQDVPEPLYGYLHGEDSLSRHVRKHLRAYNCVFQFASMAATLAMPSSGISSFRISGSVSHLMGPLHPAPGAPPQYAQLYILDADAQLAGRCSLFRDLRPEVIQELQAMLEACNPHAKVFRTAAQQAAESSMHDVRIILSGDNTPDRRRYNLPSSTEIAGIIPDAVTPVHSHRDIVVHLTAPEGGRVLQRLTELNGAYDSLHFVLLAPRGEPGWHLGIPRNTTPCTPAAADSSRQNEDSDANEAPAVAVPAPLPQRAAPAASAALPPQPSTKQRKAGPRCKVTCREFYSHRMQYRPGSQTLLRGGRLTQEYVVDAYAKQENDRLSYIANNQQQLRSDLYQGVADAVAAGDSGRTTGTRVVLPSSFTGSPRYMHQMYQDAMALVRVHGKPDLFITFTCNPNWEEIQSALLPGQTADDRPDIVARVFRQKMKALLDDLMQHGVLGRPVAHCWTVEFQKRGLPHVHILLILAPEHKLQTPDDYDHVVCAELPDKDAEPELFVIVSQHMMHGPCGPMHPECACMDKGVCSKHYPRDFCEHTTENEDGYPLYRRRNDGRSVQKKGVPLDNRSVVPYNRALCLKYNAHINVEVCSSISAVKYIHKYIYKGPDRAQVGPVDPRRPLALGPASP